MTSHRSLLSVARTLLFVPANRPDRFQRAGASGADLVVIDLEDAVPPAEKEVARTRVITWLEEGHQCAVRVNAEGTPWHAADVQAVAAHAAVIVLPKADSAAGVQRLRAGIPDSAAVLALVETATGVLDAAEIAAAGADRLAFGSYDLAAQLGISPESRPALQQSRSMLVLASAAAGLAPPVDGITGDLNDENALRDDIAHAASLGFSGKFCIHPRQVAPTHEALAPSQADVAWAESVVAAAAGESGVVVHEGQMVDKPVVDRASRLLARLRELEQ